MDTLREKEVLQQAKWDMLRSDIYIRDKGMCWVCNTKVELRDYDLGHLVDRCNGGTDDYENLAVMHKKCNISKPRHSTLEEAMKWKLTPSYLSNRPIEKMRPKEQLSFISPSQSPTSSIAINRQQESSSPYSFALTRFKRTTKLHGIFMDKNDEQAVKQLVIEYFTNRPELLRDNAKYQRAEALRQLSTTLNWSIVYIRRYIVEAGLVKPRQHEVTDGSQYHYVSEHLDELLKQYYSGDAMELKPYSIFIMFYLAGMPERIDNKNLHSITKRVKQLHLPIRHIEFTESNASPVKR